jgi:hypothetical protein
MGEQYNYTQRQVYLSQQILLFDEELIFPHYYYHLPVWMVRYRRGQLMIYGFELLGFRSDSREPLHSEPDHQSEISPKFHHSK